MSTMAVRHKRSFSSEEDSIQGNVAKRFCPASPLVVNGISKQEMVKGLHRLFPRVHAIDIAAILKSVNYSSELAAESLHRLQQSENEATASASNSNRAPGKKRSFHDVENANAQPDVLSHWADRIVGSLQGCPSMDGARSRTRQSLQAFQDQYLSQQHQAQGCGSNEAADKRLSELQQANLILYRRVTETNARNKELSERVGESEEGLRNGLLDAQQKIERLEQQNRQLQWVIQHAASGGQMCGQPVNPFGGQGPPNIF